MKIFAAFLLVVACTNANSIHRYGWAPGMESIFRFESQVLSGIPDIEQSQFSGLKIMANVHVQAQQDYTLRVKFEQARLVTLNGKIDITDANRIVEHGGPRSGSFSQDLPQEFKKHLETPILVHLKRGLVEEFFVSRDEPTSVTNLKRSLLSQLQLDVSGSQQVGSKITQGPPKSILSGPQAYHKVLEESVLGRCYTMYTVVPLTTARVMELERSWYDEETMAKLQPSTAGKIACENKQYYEIIKTRDLDQCSYRPVFQHVSGAEFSGDVSKAHTGNLFTHMSSSTTYVCGELSSFNIRKIVVDDQIVANPVGYNTEQKEKTRSRIMLELIKKQAITTPMPTPSSSRKETTLVYTYPEQRELQNQMSAEVVQKTQQILGTKPVLPQPKLEEAPKTLIPSGVQSSEIISQVVSQMRAIATKVFESPESCTAELDVSGKLLTVSKLMQGLSLQEIQQVWTQTLAGVAQQNKQAAKHLIIDTAAMVGTNPATMFVLKKIDASEIDAIKATVTIQSAMKSIRTPTKELLSEILRTVKQWKNGSNMDKKKLLTPTLLQLSNLVFNAYVNPSTMVSNYPVRIYGIFGAQDSPVINDYISFLKQWLEQSEQDPKRTMKPVIVTALGKLGLLDATKPLLKVAQGLKGEEPMYRALAVNSLRRAAIRYSRELRAVLLAIINNPVEHADVRIAAISVLPWTQPGYAELQQIAIRSWYEKSNQVSSFARSTFASLMYTKIPELRAVAAKVRGIIHMFKPMQYGLQFSKNFQASKFVKYLLGAVTNELEIVQTKDDFGPSKIAKTSNVIMEVLGEGIRMKLDSWSIYSQGLDNVIDPLLAIREVFGDALRSSPMVEEELKKMATNIRLEKRTLPELKAFIKSYNLGYEYALQLTVEQILNLISELRHSNIKDKLARGISGEFVSATNLLFAEFQGPNEIGLPMITRRDLVSVMAAKAYAKTESVGYGITARMVPVWNIKQQSDSGIVSPFPACSQCVKKGYLGNGVAMSLHSSLPLEAKVVVRTGELDIELKVPQQTIARGTNHEVIHALITPYTVRAPWASVMPLNKARDAKEILTGSPLKRFSKHFHGLFNGQFTYESDNEFVDFYSYWEKIRQHSPLSLPMTLPFVSSVRKSSARMEINPDMSELKEVSLKLKLFTQQPSALMSHISKPFGQSILQEIKTIPSLNTVHSLLPQSPATIVKIEAAYNGGQGGNAVEGYAVVGYKQVADEHFKSAAGFAGKLKQGSSTYGILYEGELKRPTINARWNKEQILNQPLELVYNGKVVYGTENDQQSQNKIELRSKFYKTHEQIRSVQESSEFKTCEEVERAGRKLSPICIKVRNQAGSLDRAEIDLDLPQEIYQSPVLSTIEEFVKAIFFAHYKQMPMKQIPTGRIILDLAFARAGDVAHVVVEHQRDTYNLTNIRVPYNVQGLMPLLARNPVVDAIEQRLTYNNAPASCRVEPSMVSTFDNRTYDYTINECEHVLLTDGQRTLPVAVMTRTISGQQKMVKILAGQSKVELIPESSSMRLKVNGAVQSCNPGTPIIKKDPQTGETILEIKRYHDGVFHVYSPLQMMHVLTDGKRVEIVAPQILNNRAQGLCGNMNGEQVADLTTPNPKRCIMKPKLVAISYILNKNENQPQFAQCRVRPEILAEFQRANQQCIKEEIVKTPILTIFERVQRMMRPLGDAHKVEKQDTGSRLKNLALQPWCVTCVMKNCPNLDLAQWNECAACGYQCLPHEQSPFIEGYASPSGREGYGMGGGYGSGTGRDAYGMGGEYGSRSGGNAYRMGGGYESGSESNGSGSTLNGNGMGGGYGSLDSSAPAAFFGCKGSKIALKVPSARVDDTFIMALPDQWRVNAQGTQGDKGTQFVVEDLGDSHTVSGAKTIALKSIYGKYMAAHEPSHEPNFPYPNYNVTASSTFLWKGAKFEVKHNSRNQYWFKTAFGLYLIGRTDGTLRGNGTQYALRRWAKFTPECIEGRLTGHIGANEFGYGEAEFGGAYGSGSGNGAHGIRGGHGMGGEFGSGSGYGASGMGGSYGSGSGNSAYGRESGYGSGFDGANGIGGGVHGMQGSHGMGGEFGSGNGAHGNRGGYGSVSGSGAYGYEGGYGSGLEGGNGMVGGYRSGSGSGANGMEGGYGSGNGGPMGGGFGAGSGTGGYGIGGGYGSEGLKSKLGDSLRKCDPNNPSCPSDEVCGLIAGLPFVDWLCCNPNNPACRH